ncbi:hypothetical protein FOZ62_024855 [Perkinsus olseni]|uniref:Peptidase A1 domain-containing protein n=1 Tax=Perkinsus olseni TaxID=32597 RepID=A0A7J6RKM2_PEROL|nr:hypothetical protein FOZ62_024855 [Perkinsus olseni]
MLSVLAASAFETGLHSLRAAWARVLATPAKTVTLPVDKGFVTVNIAGQEVRVFLDSLSYGLIVMDGHWYEAKYGEGACEAPDASCYFCPMEDPCDFTKEEEIMTADFADGTALQGVIRKGRLRLGDGREASDFVFKIARAVSWPGSTRPHGFFGLSMMPPSSRSFRTRISLEKESVLGSLLRHNVIHRLSYTLRPNSKQASAHFCGRLTLGDSIDKSHKARYVFPEWPDQPSYHRAMPALSVSTVELLDSQGRVMDGKSSIHQHNASFRVGVDTGSRSIFLPHPGVLQGIERTLKRGMREHGYGEELIGRSWHLNPYGVAFVALEFYKFLPVLRLRLEGGNDSVPIEIHPIHYCTLAQGEYVVIYVSQGDLGTLGTPFFVACTVHVDHTDNTIALLKN